MKTLRKLYRKLPSTIREPIGACMSYVPFTRQHHQRRWVQTKYGRFGIEQRKYLFLSIARFCHINRPSSGYYFEFGCHGAVTMRMAYDHSRHLFDWTFVGFDSFEGLPEIEEIDKQDIWQKGKLATSEEEFRRIVIKHGIPKDRLITVKGFYDKTLTEDLKKRLLPRKAAVVYVDCDLYASTVPVLRFIKDFLQKGTILVFDDWNCFHGDPDKGERLAFSQFREQNPDLVFEDFVQTNEAKAFIFVGQKNKADRSS
jgi:hypothetical protein